MSNRLLADWAGGGAATRRPKARSSNDFDATDTSDRSAERRRAERRLHAIVDGFASRAGAARPAIAMSVKDILPSADEVRAAVGNDLRRSRSSMRSGWTRNSSLMWTSPSGSTPGNRAVEIVNAMSRKVPRPN